MRFPSASTSERIDRNPEGVEGDCPVCNKSVPSFHLGRAMQRDPESVLKAVPELTELLAEDELEVVVGERFPLSAADAHEYIENRQSTGKVVLEP